jgi:Fe2+ transport system protein B
MTAAKKYNATKKAKMYERIGKKVGRDLGLKDKRLVENAIEEASVSGSVNMMKLVQRLKAVPVFAEVAVKGKEVHKRFVESHKKSIANAKARIKANAEAKEAAEKNAKKAGKEAYNAKIAFANESDRLHKEATKEVARRVSREFRRLYEGTKKEASEKDINTVASLRAHGFTLSAADHHHLKKHLRDAATEAIINRVDAEASGDMKACAVCELQNYLMRV